MVAPVTRTAQNLLLALIGGTLIWLTASGTYTNYVRPLYGPVFIIAGAVLLVLGGTGLAAELRRATVGLPDEPHHAGRAPWLLCVPVLVVFLIAPPALGSYTAGRQTDRVLAAQGRPTPPPHRATDRDQAVPLSLLDFLVWTQVQDPAKRPRGQLVELTGFVLPRKPSGWYLTRLKITCCAADAAAIRLRVRNPADLPKLPADTWIRVIARWVPPPNGIVHLGDMPDIRILHLTKVPKPRDPYE